MVGRPKTLLLLLFLILICCQAVISSSFFGNLFAFVLPSTLRCFRCLMLFGKYYFGMAGGEGEDQLKPEVEENWEKKVLKFTLRFELRTFRDVTKKLQLLFGINVIQVRDEDTYENMMHFSLLSYGMLLSIYNCGYFVEMNISLSEYCKQGGHNGKNFLVCQHFILISLLKFFFIFMEMLMLTDIFGRSQSRIMMGKFILVVRHFQGLLCCSTFFLKVFLNTRHY